jgi:hypothetical protein
MQGFFLVNMPLDILPFPEKRLLFFTINREDHGRQQFSTTAAGSPREIDSYPIVPIK